MFLSIISFDCHVTLLGQYYNLQFVDKEIWVGGQKSSCPKLNCKLESWSGRHPAATDVRLIPADVMHRWWEVRSSARVSCVGWTQGHGFCLQPYGSALVWFLLPLLLWRSLVGCRSVGSQRVAHGWATSLLCCFSLHLVVRSCSGSHLQTPAWASSEPVLTAAA